MGIKASEQNKEAEKAIEKFIQRQEERIFEYLSRIGEGAIDKARKNGFDKGGIKAPYLDQTGNLRSSIGYAIAHNGKLMSISSFEKVKGGSAGATEGKSFAERIAKEHSDQTWCLVLVAGMKYAFYVENGHTDKRGRHIKGRDVLTSAELVADDLAKQLFEK